MTAKHDIICWWSGGITSSVACSLSIDFFGIERCRFIMIDTQNEHDDTYRFKVDCEKWYGRQIEIISAIGTKYNTIQDVWLKHKSLNVATGAICSSELKRKVRMDWQKDNQYTHQVFGFEFNRKEFNRAMGLKLNWPDSKPIFPLLMMGYSKEDCIEVVNKAGIKPPVAYSYGLKNNNCLKTGCVQGGIGYWKKIQQLWPDKFNAMADMEHRLTESKGKPVTMLKDQSKEAKLSMNELVFLRKHPSYPLLKCIDDMGDVPIEPLMECNGFCGINDMNKPTSTTLEINFEK